jgi:hypothetical protein
MFCQCYLNTKSAAHSAHGEHASGHFCRFNNAFKVNRDKYGNVDLDGTSPWARWIGQFCISILASRRSSAMVSWPCLPSYNPVKWNSFKVGDDHLMEWGYTKDRAVAKLDGGRAAEVVLNRMSGNTNEPIVIRNLKYWGAPRNEGFVLMPNEVEAYRLGDKAYEFKGTNGFMITVDIASKDLKK